MLLQEKLGVPVKAWVLVDCPTHLSSVRVAITNIAVIRTYFTESSLELVRTVTGKLGSPPMPGACAAVLAGVWPARRNCCEHREWGQEGSSEGVAVTAEMMRRR